MKSDHGYHFAMEDIELMDEEEYPLFLSLGDDSYANYCNLMYTCPVTGIPFLNPSSPSTVL